MVMNTAMARLKMKKALVVEDDPDLLEILTRQLDMMGFSVITAKHGKEGVEKAFEEKPHLILMDIMMPEMSGRDATRMIRGNPDTEDIPILVVSALYLGSEIRSCFEAGCNDYISKPFAFKQLQQKIQDLA